METPNEMYSRVLGMTQEGGTWDLSKNDIAAIKCLLADREYLRKMLHRIERDTCESTTRAIAEEALETSYAEGGK